MSQRTLPCVFRFLLAFSCGLTAATADEASQHSEFVLPDTLAKQLPEYPDLRRVVAVYGARAFSHNRRVTAIAFGPQDRTLVTASGKEIREWSFPAGELQRTFQVDALNESDLSINDARDRLVIAGDKGQVQLLEWPSGAVLREFSTLDVERSKIRYVHDVAISPNGAYLAIGLRRGSWTKPQANAGGRVSQGGVLLYRLRDGKLLFELDEVGGAGIALAWTRDSGTLAVGRFDGKLLLLNPGDLKTHRVINMAMSNDTESPVAVTFSPDGSRLAALTSHLKMGAWDVNTAKGLWLNKQSMRGGRMAWHGSPGEIVWDASGNRLIAGSWQTSAPMVLDADTGKNIAPAGGDLSWGRCIAQNKDSSVIVGTRDHVVTRFDPDTLQPIREKAAKFDLTAGTAHVLAGPDGKHFVTSGSKSVFVWHVDQSEPVGQIKASGMTRLAPDGSTIVVVSNGSSGKKGTVRLFNLKSRQLTQSWQLPDRICDDAKVTPDGKHLVVCGRHEVWRFAMDDGKLVQSITPEQNEVGDEPSDWLNGITLSGDGKLMAVCVSLRNSVRANPVNDTSRRTLQVYDLMTGRQVSTMVCPGSANGYEFSSSGEFLVATATEAVSTIGTRAFPAAIMFDVESGLEVGRLFNKSVTRGTRFLAVDRTAQRFFTTSGGRILVWGLAGEKPIADWLFPGAFQQLAVFPGGGFVIAPHSDGTLWRIHLDAAP